MNGSMPPQFSRGAEYEQPDILASGMSLLRIIGGCMGLFAIFMGLVLAYNVFGMVRDMIIEPETLSGFLDKWEINMAETAAPAADPELEAPAVDTAAALDASADAAPKAEAEPRAAVPQAPPKPVFHPAVQRHSNSPGAQDMEDLREILRVIRSGTFARPLGAFFILLLVAILARIPIALMVTGARVLGLVGVVREKKKKEPTAAT